MSTRTYELPVVEADGAPVAGARTPLAAPSARLIGTLAGSGAFAGLLIVLVFGWAQPRISAHQASVLADAVGEVLGAPARTERLWIVGGRIVPALPAGADSAAAERVWAGYDAAGTRVGFAVLGAEAGFADVITLLFGYDPAQKRVLGMKVLDNKETPGLGDRIVIGQRQGNRHPRAGCGRIGRQMVDRDVADLHLRRGPTQRLDE